MKRIVVIRCEIDSSGGDAEVVAIIANLIQRALTSPPNSSQRLPLARYLDVSIDDQAHSVFAGLANDACGRALTVPCIRPLGHEGECEVSEP